MSYILSLDQGTSSSRAIIYTPGGEFVGSAQHTFEMILPDDGWVEQEPEDLWLTIIQAGRDAIAANTIEPADIACIGITNQRETTILWDRQTGEPLYNGIVWQDRRTADQCAAMRRDELGGLKIEEFINQRTGLLIDPYFSSTKLAWLLTHVEGAAAKAAAGDLCFGTVDTYLMWRLTNGQVHATDATNASRTQLFDIHQQCWCDELLDYFSIPKEVMPEVKDSAGYFGVADAQWFGADIPITGVAGDQQAALVGHGCFSQGMTKSTYGTGCFVMVNTGPEPVSSKEKLLTTVAYRVAGETTYALEGSIFVAGVALQWLRDQLGLITDVSETQAAFERTQGDNAGVFVVPTFTGMGAPHWQPNARGLITGLSLDSTRDHLLTAFLQSVAFQTHELLLAMSRDGAQVDCLRIDGGMVVNDALCQFLADVLDMHVQRPKDVETTALGAAMLAGVGHGLFANLSDAAGAWRIERDFVPTMALERRQNLLAGYAQATAQVLTMP